VTMGATDGPTMATLPECCDHGGDRWSHNGNTARVLLHVSCIGTMCFKEVSRADE